MLCQFCGRRIRSAKDGCKNCKPKITHAEFDEPFFPCNPAKQIAVVISANGKEYAGYLPLCTLKTPEGLRESLNNFR